MDLKEKILEQRSEYLLPGLKHFYEDPPLFKAAYMQYMYDEKEKRYTDFSGGHAVVNCGHSNSFVLERVIEQLRNFQHTTNNYLTEPITKLAERLAEITPSCINRSFFCSSWGEANEGALMVARNHSGRRKIIALEGSLHGRTYLAMSATHIPSWRTDPFLSQDISFIPNAENPEASLEMLRKLLAKEGGQYSAMIAEVIQGAGGVVTPPKWYFSQMQAELHAHNVLLIADERETGFARTGRMFAFEHYGIVPDILVYANSLGNGMPIAGFSAIDDISKNFTKPYISTLGGNPTSCAAALAVLDYLEYNSLCDGAERKGDLLKSELVKLQDKHDSIEDVRGIGLMVGAKLDKNSTQFTHERMKDLGFIIGIGGPEKNVLVFQPPLVLEENDIYEMIEALDKTLSK